MRIWGLLVVVCGCIQSSSIVCRDGQTCPADTTCVQIASLSSEICAQQSELDACTGSADGSPCLGNGNCLSGVCLHHCGDGYRNGAEQCDGADLGSAANCSDLGYYAASPLVCTPDCTYDLAGDYSAGCHGFCGDGVVNGPELCEDTLGWTDPRVCVDYGFDAGSLGCARCGPSFARCKSIGFVRSLAKAGAIHGSAHDDVWVVSVLTAYHYDGTSWTEHDMSSEPSDASLYPVWTEPTGHAWAAGSRGTPAAGEIPVIASWDGTAWTDVPVSGTGRLAAIWASGAGDAWAVGQDSTSSGSIVHTSGGTADAISVPSLPPLWGIWGSAANDIWAVGDNGTILHYGGTTWQLITPAVTGISLGAVYGSSATDVWAVGHTGSGPNNSVILHNTGSGWTTVPVPDGASELSSVWTDGTYVWIGGYHSLFQYDGTLWTPLLSTVTVPLHGLWGSSATDVWVTVFDNDGSFGMDHYSGAAWARWHQDNEAISAGWFDGVNVWTGVTGADGLEQYRGGAWTNNSAMTGMNALWASGPTDVWAARGIGNPMGTGPNGEIDHYDGASWTPSVTFNGTTTPPRAMWGSGTHDVWAVGGSGFWHYDGAWSHPSTTPALAVWGTGPADVWAASITGDVLHYDGQSWSVSRQAVPGDSILAFWGSSPSDVWAVGSALFHYDGTTWSASHPAYPFYFGIFGTSASDVFAVTAGSSVLHFDGTGWSRVRLAYGDTGVPDAIWGGPHHVFLGLASGSVVDLERLVAW